jgi:esterase/lipase
MTIDATMGRTVPDEHATTEYTEATRRIKFVQRHEPPEMLATGRTQLITHGYRTERVAVLFHGYSSAPQQFRALGQRLFALGTNVYLPRAPQHGLPDPLTTAHARLTVGELKQATEQALEIAAGLGEHITIMGLSMGGLMAGWAAQHHAEIDRAMLIAPALGFRAIPARLTPLVREALLALPNVFRWWDPTLKDKVNGPKHAYPRYASHVLGQLLRLSRDLQAAAARSAPAARSVIVVTNANDESVDNASVARLVTTWHRSGAGNIRTFEFNADDKLPHDLIDPDQPNQRVDYVYPVLLKLLEQ